MNLATEVLAATLIRPGGFPALSDKEIAAARRRLADTFQKAWIEECTQLLRLERDAA